MRSPQYSSIGVLKTLSYSSSWGSKMSMFEFMTYIIWNTHKILRRVLAFFISGSCFAVTGVNTHPLELAFLRRVGGCIISRLVWHFSVRKHCQRMCCMLNRHKLTGASLMGICCTQTYCIHGIYHVENVFFWCKRTNGWTSLNTTFCSNI